MLIRDAKITEGYEIEAPWILRNEFPLAKQEHMADAIAIIYAGMVTPAFDWIKSVTR